MGPQQLADHTASTGDEGAGEVLQQSASDADIVGSAKQPKRGNLTAEGSELPQEAPSEVGEFSGNIVSPPLPGASPRSDRGSPQLPGASPRSDRSARDSTSNNADLGNTSSVSVLADGLSVK